MQKLLTFFSKNISVYAIFDDQNFNDMLTNDIVTFEQLGPGSTLFAKAYLSQYFGYYRNIFPFSRKHMLWILIRSTSSRHFC